MPRTSDLSDTFAGNRRRLVHLWEDQWDEHSSIVRSRLLTMLGRSRRIFARKCDARRIDSATLEAFLQRNHLWSATKARYRYGLYDRDEKVLVAVASFSPRWKLRRDGQTRASHELIRYCSRRGESVVGGISKLLAAFSRDAAPDERGQSQCAFARIHHDAKQQQPTDHANQCAELGARACRLSRAKGVSGRAAFALCAVAARGGAPAQ